MKTATVYHVFRKVYSDFGIKDTGWYDDGVNWIAEALQAIGHHSGFTKNVSSLTVADHVAFLPICAESLLGIMYEGFRLKYGQKIWSTVPEKLESVYNNNTVPYGISNPCDVNTPIIAYRQYLSAAYSDSDYYTEELGAIKTSFSEGQIDVLYLAYKTDSEGNPLVPASYDHMTAYSWYLLKMLLMSGRATHPSISWEIADRKWSYFKRMAMNEAAFPTLDQAERYTETFVNMISANAGFSNTYNT